jgi:RNA recognition motif-containing protein
MEIFVSNLSYQMGDVELRDAFAAFGDVRRATIVKDRETGKSRGFGFVDMPDAEAGRLAVNELNGKVVDGRALMVSEARPREQRTGPGEFRPRPPFGQAGSPPPFARPSMASNSTGGPGSSGTLYRSPTPSYRPPTLPVRNPDMGSDLPEESPEEKRRANRATAPKARRKPDHVEEARRRNPIKGVEKGHRTNPRINPDDEEDEVLPVRIR